MIGYLLKLDRGLASSDARSLTQPRNAQLRYDSVVIVSSSK